MRMNVLLVDDEEYVLDYLEESIDWPGYGISHMYRAGSVDEALEIVSLMPIAILITDIRMPEKDGLELLATIHSRRPETKVILLSGYSEFEYAKKALQYGAADYLLKPVTNEEVEACLQKVLALIEKENRIKEDLLAAKDVLQFGISRMREHLLLDLLLGKNFPKQELERHLRTLRIPMTTEEECILALLRIEADAADTSHEDFELFSYAIVNMAEEIFSCQSDPKPTLWTCRDSHRFVIMVLPLDSLGGIDRITERINQLQQAVKTFLKRTVSILVSEPISFREKLNNTYLHAMNRFWRFIGTRKDVVLTIDERTDSADLKPLVRLHESPALVQLMESGRWEEAVSRVAAILEELNLPDYRTQEHITEVVYHLYSCFSYLAHKQGDSFSEMIGGFSLSGNPLHFHSTEAIHSWAIPLMDQFRQSLNETLSGQNRVIRQIQDYIEHNLQEDLSLNKIGEHVYLHPVYLSRLYKKETGESLSSYITRIRMDKAAQLLTRSNKKVSDIAVEVGYHKTQYFIRLFKEYYDSTPQIYRNR
jgi:two-component system, response regulator YesN